MAMPLAIVGTAFADTWENRGCILMRQKISNRFVQGGITRDVLRKVFSEVDIDGSGKINRAEFGNLIASFNVGLTDVQENKIFRELDKDRSGVIEFAEFSEFLFPEVNIATDDDEEPKKPDPKIRIRATLTDLASKVAAIAQGQQELSQAVALLASEVCTKA